MNKLRIAIKLFFADQANTYSIKHMWVLLVKSLFTTPYLNVYHGAEDVDVIYILDLTQ